MKNSEKLDQLLRTALSEEVGPSEELNQKILKQIEGGNKMRTIHKKRMSRALIAAVMVLIMSTTAFAAWKLLDPGQVAESMGDKKLAQAFESSDAIRINKSIQSGGYDFTLLGIVSGKGLSAFENTDQEIKPDKTYAVMSIAKEDGSPMPSSTDPNYGEVPFFVSPLIKGVAQPWLVNASTMGGGYSELVLDGILYRLVECDGVEMFADRGLYLCASTTNFYDINAYNYDEKTGVISPNPNFKGANALFDLPIDKSKADPEKAEKYLEELLNPPQDESSSDEPFIDLEKELAGAKVIPDSVQQIKLDQDGTGSYEYDGAKDYVDVKHTFAEGEIGVWKTSSLSGSDTERRGIQFMLDQDGNVTGRTVKLELK